MSLGKIAQGVKPQAGWPGFDPWDIMVEGEGSPRLSPDFTVTTDTHTKSN